MFVKPFERFVWTNSFISMLNIREKSVALRGERPEDFWTPRQGFKIVQNILLYNVG